MDELDSSSCAANSPGASSASTATAASCALLVVRFLFGISPTASSALRTCSPSLSRSIKKTLLTFSKAISRSSSGSS